MKFIYYTNNVVFSSTLVLYLTVIYGMFMQIILGGIQIILFFILLFNYDKFSEKIKKHLSIYGALTTIFLLFFFFAINYENTIYGNTILSIGLFILVPLSIATYFTYIVYQLKQHVL